MRTSAYIVSAILHATADVAPHENHAITICFLLRIWLSSQAISSFFLFGFIDFVVFVCGRARVREGFCYNLL